MISLRPVDTRSVHEDVQEKIKEYILANKLAPDTLLPTEVEFAHQLGVSRPVVREALRALESLGVLYSRRGEGRYVADFSLEPIARNLNYSLLFDLQDARELLEVREHLEESYIGESVAKMDPATLEELYRVVQVMTEKAAAAQLFNTEERQFHMLLYRPIGNRLLEKLLNVFWEVYENLPDRSLHIVRDLDVQARNHKRIVQAVEAHDAGLARQTLMEHFGSMEERLGRLHGKF